MEFNIYYCYHATGSGKVVGLSSSDRALGRMRCSNVLEYLTRGVSFSKPHSSDKKLMMLVCVYSPPKLDPLFSIKPLPTQGEIRSVGTRMPSRSKAKVILLPSCAVSV